MQWREIEAPEDIKEAEICKRFNITEFGVGGSSKINDSSSVLLSDYNNNKFKKALGDILKYYRKGKAAKKLKKIINPNESLSTQIHEKRHEKWIIVEGVGKCS